MLNIKSFFDYASIGLAGIFIATIIFVASTFAQTTDMAVQKCEVDCNLERDVCGKRVVNNCYADYETSGDSAQTRKKVIECVLMGTLDCANKMWTVCMFNCLGLNHK